MVLSLQDPLKLPTPDLMLGPIDRPIAAVDFKSGLAGIRSSWIKLLRANLPTSFKDIPVIEINLK